VRRAEALLWAADGVSNAESQLRDRIDCWVSHWNDNPGPFVWTEPADGILNEVARGTGRPDTATVPAGEGPRWRGSSAVRTDRTQPSS
jgi:hypothetical protein